MKQENDVTHDTYTHGYKLKEKIYGIIKLTMFLSLLVIGISTTNNILKRKEGYYKMREFFEQKEDFDILLFGSSHMLDSVYPMELWRDYGMVSYNLGNHSETIVGSYYNMDLACKYTRPKMVVIDTYMVTSNDKIRNDSKLQIHNAYDAYPISYRKYLAIKDTFDGKDMLDNSIEFFFNFSLYHTRWQEVKKNDFVYSKNYQKGAEEKVARTQVVGKNDFNSAKTYSGEETLNMKYLRKMIEYCKENDIEILPILVPYAIQDEDKNSFTGKSNILELSKYVKKICDEYSLNYLNFFENDVIDYSTDMFDTGHVNQSGARKITKSLGEYISKNYSIPDQRENPNYDFWHDEFEKYKKEKLERIVSYSWNDAMVSLYGDNDFSCKIKLKESLDRNKPKLLQDLLASFNNDYSVSEYISKYEDDKNIQITLYDKKYGEKIIDLFYKI